MWARDHFSRRALTQSTPMACTPQNWPLRNLERKFLPPACPAASLDQRVFARQSLAWRARLGWKLAQNCDKNVWHGQGKSYVNHGVCRFEYTIYWLKRWHNVCEKEIYETEKNVEMVKISTRKKSETPIWPLGDGVLAGGGLWWMLWGTGGVLGWCWGGPQ